MPVREFVARRRGVVIAAAVVLAAAVVFVLIWFQPQKLFTDKVVDEPAPAGPAPTSTTFPADSAAAFTGGPFQPLEHEVSGHALLLAPRDRPILRFEEFKVENGPDLFVYLSSADPDEDPRALGKDFVDLGPLKGNVGNQNYEVPAGTDLEKYRTVVIWCRRFTVAFAAAELS